MAETELAAIVAEIERLDRERDAAVRQLRALVGAQAVSSSPSRRRKVDATDAFRRAGFTWTDDKIQRVCRNHAGEWAIKVGTWCVFEPDFSNFVARVEAGGASFRF